MGKVKVDEEVGFSQSAADVQEVVVDAEEVVFEALRSSIRLGGGIARPVTCSRISMVGGIMVFTLEGSSLRAI